MGDMLSFWTFTIPNYILAVLIYTLIGRIILGFLFRSKPDAVMMRVFVQITDPFVRLVRQVTPRVIADPLVVVMAIFWLMALRIVLFLVTRALSVAPTLAG